MILMVKKLLAHFMKKNCKKQINKNLELKKYLKERVINYMLNVKGIVIQLIARLIKKTSHKMSKYFPEPFGRDISVKIDLSNYTTKTDVKILRMLILQVLY